MQTFILQQPPVFITQEVQQPVLFYKKWYHTDVENGRPIYNSEGRNLFIERIIKRYFKGKSAELAYADMLRYFYRFNHYEGLDVVFEHFKRKYASSRYIPVFNNAMAEIVAKEQQALSNKMIFVAGNGSTLNTMDDVIHLMKGKTVFVDMWGTWCGPCREELQKFTPQIRACFKDKNITFLYIANKDINHLAEWKKTIAYYKIEGTHILANDRLDENIMTQLKSTGYPTHFIIKKDGTVLKMKAQNEANIQQVIKEIAGAL